MQHQLNTTPINQFTQMLRSAELSNQKELKIPIQQARLLSLALTDIMEKLNQDYETLFNSLKKTLDTESSTITIKMDGGDFR